MALGYKYHIDFEDGSGLKHEIQIYSRDTYKEMRLGKMAHWSHKVRKIDALENQKFEVIPGLAKAVNAPEIFSIILNHINNYKYVNIIKLGRNEKAPVVMKTLRFPLGSSVDNVAKALSVKEPHISVCAAGEYFSDKQGELSMVCRLKRSGDYLIEDGDLLIIADKDKSPIPQTVLLIHNNKIFTKISFGSSPVSKSEDKLHYMLTAKSLPKRGPPEGKVSVFPATIFSSHSSSPISKVNESMLKEDIQGLLKELRHSLLAQDNPSALIRLLSKCDKAVREGIQVDINSPQLQEEVALRARKMWLIDGGYENEPKETQDRRYALAAADILAQYSAKAHVAPIESRWPMLKAVTLLNADEEELLLKQLKAAVRAHPLLRRIPLIDFMLLMLGDIPKDWTAKLVPHLIGKVIFILSPEGRKVWKGGLGPVITFHGDALQRLLDGYARVIHIEADYQYIRDKVGSLRDLHFGQNTSTEIIDVGRFPEADFSMKFDGKFQGEIVKVESRKGRSPKGAEVVFLKHTPEDNHPFYTKVLYDYEAQDNPISGGDFSRFYSLAALRFIAWFTVNYNIKSEDVVILANDSQAALANIFIYISVKSGICIKL